MTVCQLLMEILPLKTPIIHRMLPTLAICCIDKYLEILLFMCINFSRFAIHTYKMFSTLFYVVTTL